MKTNAPRMVTVLAALVLTAVGVCLAILDITAMSDPVMDAVGTMLTQQEAGWWALAISPVLLAVGSFFKGV